MSKQDFIYIPVWLDQKYFKPCDECLEELDLHSSMVRLEMKIKR